MFDRDRFGIVRESCLNNSESRAEESGVVNKPE